MKHTLYLLLLSFAAFSCAPEQADENAAAAVTDAGLEDKASSPSSLTCTGSTLASKQALTPGKGLCSPNGAYAFGLRSDGKLVLSAGALVTWQAGVSGGARLAMQGDGNLVVYSSSNAALWSSRTAGKSGASLTLQDDGLAVLRYQGTVVWSVGTRDECPQDPNKVVPGSCGCGKAEGTCTTSGSGELKIVVFSVGSADSALIVFPTGATMLMDSATQSMATKRVIPFLKRHRINRLNYYAESHPHPDHIGGQGPLKNNGFITAQTKMWNWTSFKFGDRFDLEGTKWLIYNARDTVFHSSSNTPDDEDVTNANSLSFRMEYNGFVYSSTGDEGRRSQQRFLNTYPNLVRAHVRNTAHHLWGPVLPAFDKATDPFLFIISSENSVKQERSWSDFMGVVCDLKNGQGRLRDYAFTPDTGHVFVRARTSSDWGYSYCKSVDSCILW